MAALEKQEKRIPRSEIFPPKDITHCVSLFRKTEMMTSFLCFAFNQVLMRPIASGGDIFVDGLPRLTF
jgi:hypothetical protein